MLRQLRSKPGSRRSDQALDTRRSCVGPKQATSIPFGGHQRTGVKLAATVTVLSALLAGCRRPPSADTEASVTRTTSAIVQPLVASFSVPASVDFKPLAVAASSALTVSDRAQLLGSTANTFAASTSTGSSKSTYGNQAKVGDVVSIPSVSFGASSSVNGSVTSGGTVTGAPVGTPVLQNQTLATTTYQWTVPFNTSATAVTVNSGSRTLAPGSYGTVQLNGGTLVVGPGTYYIDALTLNSGTTLTVNNSSAPVFIYVKSSLAFRTHMTATVQNLMLVYFGNTATALETSFGGTVVAPNASLRLAVGATAHTGAVFAKSIVVDPDVKLTQTAFGRWDLVPFDVGVAPTLNCVVQLDASTYGAVFGYNNTTGARLALGAGAHNYFSPGPTDRGQPILFLPGQVPIATFQTFAAGSQLSLTIGQQAVTASASSPACSPALSSALTQLFVETDDSRTVRQSLAQLVAHPRFATWISAIKTNAGPQLSPFQSSMIDAVQLAIANADLLGDPAALSDAQRARLAPFRAALLANPGVVALRLAGDALKGDLASTGCDLISQINQTPTLRPILPVQADSVYAQTLALTASPSLAALRATLSGVATGPQGQALLAAPGVLLGGLLSKSDLMALTIGGPIPTGLLGKIVGGVVGAVAGGVTGFLAGGPAGAVGGAIAGAIIGVATGGEIEDDSCQHCDNDGECDSGICIDQCCASVDGLGIQTPFLTGVSCPNGEPRCYSDGSCNGLARCSQGCCIDQTILVSLCPSDSCTADSDCSGGNTCQDGCCAGVCGVAGMTCNAVGVLSCGASNEPTTCPIDYKCSQGCCLPRPPG